MVQLPDIPEFYSGRNILITGATGFLGKVLVEKLLRCCPEVGTIYILVRSRRGWTPQERWNMLTDLDLFNVLKKERPDALRSKVAVLDGDVSKELLGLKEQNYKLLVENISIIFHVAATINFNDPLHKAVRMNTFGTFQIVTLALKLKDLKALMYVSTAYSNCDRAEVEEVVYPCPFNWREVLLIAERTDPVALAALTAKYLDKVPNTYILTKRLGESLVWEFKDKIPVIIFRPSVVISTWKDPVAGWVDNFTGLIGVVIGIGKGVIRTLPMTTVPDSVPVDVAARAMIVSAWHRGTSSECDDNEFIYNCTRTYRSVAYPDMNRLGLALMEAEPFANNYFYPRITQRNNMALFRVEAVYKHFLPALFADLLLRIAKRKPMLLKMQIKLQRALIALSYFTVKQWKFHNENFINLNKKIPIQDKILFDFNFSELHPTEYLYFAIKGAKKYLFKEKENCLIESQRRYKIIKYIYYSALTSFRFAILWILHKIYCSYSLVEN